ncbi:hypothetical protein JAAARDRAFT_69151 [Jaapia argillacea MUCL 33604]|uniref:Uncharacterized protein n=1 Tax=Jaapia argillacea MUCL 33604 TaxID=933084 RepID=A0A067PVG1_9AGAM|nr:hypothetical protein JAAARDRAFT_69151 [Jaapia argillacea MUCL 33604]
MSAQKYSLFEALTAKSSASPDYPVTDLIDTLIKVCARDICSFKFNHQTSYTLISRARDIRDEINVCIQAVQDLHNDSDWDKYDQYTKAIDDLEDVLLKFARFSEVYSQASPLSLENITVHTIVDEIKKWKADQTSLRDHLRKLHKSDGDLTAIKPERSQDADLLLRENYDDFNVLSKFCVNFTDRTWNNARYYSGASKSVTNIIASIKVIQTTISGKIQDPSISSALTFSVEAMLLVNLAAKMAKDETDGEKLKTLRSGKVWNQAESLVNTLKAHLTGSEPTIADLKTKWEEFLAILKGIAPPELFPPKSYVDLRKKVASVRRPFFAQAMALVKLSRTLVEHIQSSQDQKFVDDVAEIESLFNKSLETFKKAAEALTSVTDFNAETAQAINAAFTDINNDIGKCFTKYELSDWATRSAEMSAAAKADSDRMAEFEKLKNKASTTDTINNDTQVTVRISGLKSSAYTVSEKTALSALLWKISREDADSNKLLGKAFFQDRSNKRLGDETEVGTLSKDGGEVALVLATGG